MGALKYGLDLTHRRKSNFEAIFGSPSSLISRLINLVLQLNQIILFWLGSINSHRMDSAFGRGCVKTQILSGS